MTDALLDPTTDTRHPPARRRGLAAALALAAVATLPGCALLHTYSAEVASFGTWPDGRAPGRYAIERLPSQQARADEFAGTEDAAARALEAAGFTPATDAASADVLVQLGSRVQRNWVAEWDDPLWWGGPVAARRGVWLGWRWGGPIGWDTVRYDREVGVLIRDRASGTPLFEARARSDGPTRGNAELTEAMFRAALDGFPAANGGPRRVTVQMP